LRGQQLLERYINWPRISVVTRQSGYFHVNFRGSVEQEPLKDKVHIVVVNSGAEAASIANEGLRSADNTIRTDVETLRDKILGPCARIQISGHFPRWGHKSNTALCSGKKSERDADYVQPLPTLAFPPIFPPGPAGARYRHCRWRVVGTAGSKRSPRSR
jgi:hypothetical protein